MAVAGVAGKAAKCGVLIQPLSGLGSFAGATAGAKAEILKGWNGRRTGGEAETLKR